MNAYRVIARNQASTLEQGSCWREFFVFADMFMDATIEAGDAIEELRKKLRSAGIPREAADSLEVEKVEFEAEVVGKVGHLHLTEGKVETVEMWAKRVAEQTKKDMNA